MEARVSLITLGVGDIERASAFYERLGLRRSSQSSDGVAFFQLNGGVVLALYGRTDLARDCGFEETGTGFGNMTLAYNVRSEAEVDRVTDEFAAAGAPILKPPHKVFWGGYIAYVADPEGHVWEIAFNPAWPLDESGGLRLPD